MVGPGVRLICEKSEPRQRCREQKPQNGNSDSHLRLMEARPGNPWIQLGVCPRVFT
jgi:hypothetical protein